MTCNDILLYLQISALLHHQRREKRPKAQHYAESEGPWYTQHKWDISTKSLLAGHYFFFLTGHLCIYYGFLSSGFLLNSCVCECVCFCIYMYFLCNFFGSFSCLLFFHILICLVLISLILFYHYSLDASFFPTETWEGCGSRWQRKQE